MKRPLALLLAWLVGLAGQLGVAADPEPRVYQDRLRPHWFADEEGNEDRFWYRRDLPEDRREFILVDAEEGRRAPAFDHARVAEELTKLLEREVDPQTLPVDSLTVSPDAGEIVLHGRDSAWTLDLASYSVTPTVKAVGTEEGLKPLRRPPNSRSGANESAIRFINRLSEPVELFWVDGSGTRRSYGDVPADGERLINTYEGHSWLVAGKDGNPIAGFVAEERQDIAVISDEMDFEVPGRRSDRRDRSDDSARSPDGRHEVLVRGHNLFLRDMESNETRQLSYDGHPADSYARNARAMRSVEMRYNSRDPEKPTPEVYWSTDSSHFVAMRHTSGSDRQVSLIRSSPDDQLQPKLVKIPYLKPGDDVAYAKPHLFSAGDGKEIPVDDALFANPWKIGDLRWKPDSSGFVFHFNQRGHQVLRILEVAAGSGEVRPIVEERSETFICYSSKFFAKHLDATGEIIWMSERDGWNHLYLYDAETGRVKNQVTEGEWVVFGVERVDEEKRQIWFRAGGRNPDESPYNVHYYRIGFDGTGLTELTGGDGSHSVEYSPDNRYLIDTRSRPDLPPIHELRRVEDGELLCRLEEADASELTATGWMPPEPFVAKGRDGETDIHGLIIRPKNFDPERAYPVLEDIYAGPHDSFVPTTFSSGYRFQDLADRGFIIVRIDGMGTSNRSKEFHDVCWKDLADSGFPDRIAWIKAAAETYPYLDLSRVGIFGTSAGGQSAMRALLDYGDFYTAASADCGCHDNRIDKIWWNEQWMGWPVDESYVRSSNVADAHKLRGKLLLMVGEMDQNVDPASTMQVVNELIKADKDFDLLMMPNTGHGVVSTPHGKRRLMDFFIEAFLDDDDSAARTPTAGS